MLILNVIILMLLSGLFGYLLGKGKIEVVKKMRKEESKEALEIQRKMEQEQKEAMAAYNEAMKGLLGGEDGY